jgi:hypothetical protein
MKRTLSYLILAAMTVIASMGCDNKNNRSAAVRNPYTGNGYYYNQPFYQNCGQSNYQYTNPYNNTQMSCQYQNGLPQFYNQYGQPYQNDPYGYPCMYGSMYGQSCDPYAYNMYPMYYQ